MRNLILSEVGYGCVLKDWTACDVWKKDDDGVEGNWKFLEMLL